MRANTSPQVCCSRRSDRGRHCNLTCRWSVAAAMTSTSPSMSMLLLVSSEACLCARSIPLHPPSRVSAHCAGKQAQPAPMRGSRGAGHRWTARDIANNDSNTLQHGSSRASCSTTRRPSSSPASSRPAAACRAARFGRDGMLQVPVRVPLGFHGVWLDEDVVVPVGDAALAPRSRL